MGRRFLVAAATVAALSWPGSVHGQALQWLAKGGLNSATIDWSTSRIGTTLESVERRTGLTAGLALSLEASERIRLHVEALFTEKGFTERDSDGGTSSLEVAYLEVPALVGWSLTGSGARWRPQVYAGPWLSFEVGCDAVARTTTVDARFDCDEVPGDPVLRQTWDWGVAVGGLVETTVFASWITRLDLRYAPGLRNVDAAPDIDNIDAHHRGFAVTVGLGRTF